MAAARCPEIDITCFKPSPIAVPIAALLTCVLVTLLPFSAAIGARGEPVSGTLTASSDLPYDIGDHYDASAEFVNGDFNSDGATDLCAGGRIWLNEGSGRFVPSGVLANGRIVADFNRDGHADLAGVSGGNPGEVLIYLGRGDGTFLAPAIYPVGRDPVGLASGDLNGDRRRDLVVCCADSTLSVFMGQDDGFAARVIYPGPLVNQYMGGGNVVIADLNGDGHADVAVTGLLPSAVSAYHNLGDGRLADRIELPLQLSLARSMVPSDFDGDGWIDLAVGEEGSRGVEILWNDGDGAFRDRTAYPIPLASNDTPVRVDVADLSGDGKPDIAVAAYGNSWSGSWVTLLINLGNRAFDDRLTYFMGVGEGGGGAVSVIVADVDRLEGPDLVVGTTTYPYRGPGSSQIVVLRNLGGLAFAGAADFHLFRSATSGLTRTPQVQAVDFHGKRRHDLLVNHDGKSWLMRGTSGGMFSEPEAFPAGLGAVALDLNRDGRTDLLTNSNDTLIVRLCGADAELLPPSTYRGGVFVCLGDFNRDGMPDLVARQADGVLAVLTNDGTGGFGPARRSNVSASALCATGDFDGDGLDDLIIGLHAQDYAPDSVAIFGGRGDGTFSWTETYPLAPYSGQSVAQIIPSDLDNDGHLDVVTMSVGYGSSGVISALLNRGDGTLDGATTYSMYGEGNVLLVGDFNLDGKQDLAQVTYSPSRGEGYLWIALNRGNGTFDPHPPTPQMRIESSPPSLALGDFNGDGKPELAIGYLGSDVYASAEPYRASGVMVFFNRLADLPTPTLVSLVESRYTSEHVHLAWLISDPSISTVALYRSSGSAAWIELGSLHRDSIGQFEYDDRAVQVGSNYDYRLGIGEGPSHWFSPSVEVLIPLIRLTLGRVAPNPSAGDISVEFSLATNEPAEIQLVDAAGRRARSEGISFATPGPHALVLHRDRALAPGVYWLRVKQGERSALAKVAIVR